MTEGHQKVARLTSVCDWSKLSKKTVTGLHWSSVRSPSHWNYNNYFTCHLTVSLLKDASLLFVYVQESSANHVSGFLHLKENIRVIILAEIRGLFSSAQLDASPAWSSNCREQREGRSLPSVCVRDSIERFVVISRNVSAICGVCDQSHCLTLSLPSGQCHWWHREDCTLPQSMTVSDCHQPCCDTGHVCIFVSRLAHKCINSHIKVVQTDLIELS